MLPMKFSLRLFGLIGVIIFGTGLWFTFGVPGWVEEAGKNFIKNKLQEETQLKINAITSSKEAEALSAIASKYLKINESKIEKIKKDLETHSYEKIAGVIAEMRDLTCECRKKYAQMIKNNMEIELASLETAKQKLTDFMKIKYMDIVGKLQADLRIFAGSNLVIFVFLLLVSFLKPVAIKHLFLPGILLLLSSMVCSYFYLLEQDWFFTIIYNDFVGFGYLVYLSLLFSILCDVVFNKARITSAIINGLCSVIGSAASVSPC